VVVETILKKWARGNIAAAHPSKTSGCRGCLVWDSNHALWADMGERLYRPTGEKDKLVKEVVLSWPSLPRMKAKKPT